MKHTSGDIKDTISTIPIMFNSIKFRIAYILEYPDPQYGNSKRLSVYFLKLRQSFLTKKVFFVIIEFFSIEVFCSYFIFTKRRLLILF